MVAKFAYINSSRINSKSKNSIKAIIYVILRGKLLFYIFV